MRRVIVESPYKGWWLRRILNRNYARLCMLDCFKRGEAPFVSHLLYPQCLNDGDHIERQRGIRAGLAWGEKADATVIYTDHGISPGMRQGINEAIRYGRSIEYRKLRGSLSVADRESHATSLAADKGR